MGNNNGGLQDHIHPLGSLSSGTIFGDHMVSCSNPPPSDYNLNWVFGNNKLSSSNNAHEQAQAQAQLTITTTSLPLGTKDQLVSVPSLYSTQHQTPSAAAANMSATALLQKAAQMGAAASNAPLLCGFGLTTSSSSSAAQKSQIKPESGAAVAAGLGLGLSSVENSGLTDYLVMGPSPTFGNPPMTRDLLGLSIGGGSGGSTGRLSALLNSFGGSGFDVTASSTSYGGGPPERKPNGPTLL